MRASGTGTGQHRSVLGLAVNLALTLTLALTPVLTRAQPIGGLDCNDANYSHYESDGYCDDLLGNFNSRACGWDGGDCCNSTCVSADYDCEEFNCKDPSATDYNNGTCHVAGEAIGDGYCDVAYTISAHLNTAQCNWDGGDCCPSTCNGTCNHLVYNCLDNTTVDYLEKSSCQAGNPVWLGDGYCDEGGVAGTDYNNAMCAWDGGDCCSDTCESGTFVCGLFGYSCKDPNITTGNCSVRSTSYLADGYCDYDEFNVAACDWDGGDCCSDTCENGLLYACGYNNFDECLDPTSSEYRNSSVVSGLENCYVEYPEYIGDAFCDHNAGYNTANCNWDGGDCCVDTCNHTTSYHCGVIGYVCLDNRSDYYNLCGNGTANPRLGDGFCNQFSFDLSQHLNSKICNWDNGDCCKSTCVGECEDIVYDCLDETQPDYLNASNCRVSSPEWIGDGHCDPLVNGYNTEVCGWDGGDCCEESCLSETTPYECGSNGYICKDPLFDDGTCQVQYKEYLNDGYCDDNPYNTKACNWDGGDCCKQTCVNSKYECNTSSTMGANVYDCLDPLQDCRFGPDDRDSIGDGVCDFMTNTASNSGGCAWDGGDCCASTCDNSTGKCGSANFHCLNPAATDYMTCPGNQTSRYGDGFCDVLSIGVGSYLNTRMCSWDGGDCCKDTCNGKCDLFAYVCLDPKTQNYKTQSKCTAAVPSWVGDSKCDADVAGMNTAACGWDGGDCCSTTCSGRDSSTCGASEYFCVDPNATETKVVNGRCDVAMTSLLGDGKCDIQDTYNTLACGWDSGDCCKSSCSHTSDDDCLGTNICGSNGYSCRDPNGTNCPVLYASFIGDGYCDGIDEFAAYNSWGCNWDGGDCCSDTCGTNNMTYGQPTHTCGQIGYNCVDPDSSQYGKCPGRNSSSWGNGICDMWHFNLGLHLNTEICGWDGGDCCLSSCNGSCSDVVFNCLDPAQTDCGNKSTCTVASPSWIGDAFCDAGTPGYNTAECNWDGGDCCASTCLQESDFYKCGESSYACQDPDSVELNGTIPVNCSVLYISWLGDGYCDMTPNTFNVKSCNWDMGDCCPDTCEDGSQHTCGTAEYFCFDPESNATERLGDCLVDEISYLGDGYCDHSGTKDFNTHNCAWDGGDCCESTCNDDTFSCGFVGYFCLDPSDTDYKTCPGNTTKYYADGVCDQYNTHLDLHLNTDRCNWDGGDCCPSTCGSDCANIVYECLDAAQTDYNSTSDCIVASPSYIGDAFCDGDVYNTAICGWDGGDCCEESCEQEDEQYQCGQATYDCLDPLYRGPVCNVDAESYLGDGFCDYGELYPGYNTAACDWDKGDCCGDTCVSGGSFTCGSNGYNCLDPTSSNPCLGARLSYINDGYCDDESLHYNTEACAWDGGDCCPFTCVNSNFTCGSNAYTCEDPSYASCDVSQPSFVNDGYCDALEEDGAYNTLACNWDGGDCCLNTCQDGIYTCGSIGWSCRDPNQTDYFLCDGQFTDSYGNGECDMFNLDLKKHLNTEMCNWDNGDCCVSTCEGCDNIVFDCLDPSAPDFMDVSECTVALPSWVADGYCDTAADSSGMPIYNNQKCAWDGGDCCPDTCVEDTYTCPENSFTCSDPESPYYAASEVSTPAPSSSSTTTIIVVVVVVVVVILVVVIVIVVMKNKKKTVATGRAAQYATHTSRPTTMVQSVTVDGGTTQSKDKFSSFSQ